MQKYYDEIFFKLLIEKLNLKGYQKGYYGNYNHNYEKFNIKTETWELPDNWDHITDFGYTWRFLPENDDIKEIKLVGHDNDHNINSKELIITATSFTSNRINTLYELFGYFEITSKDNFLIIEMKINL